MQVPFKAVTLIVRDGSFRYSPVQSGLLSGWLGFFGRETASPLALLFWPQAENFRAYCDDCGYTACDHFRTVWQIVQEAVGKG